MTPQERAAEIITGCPEVWDRPCYMTQKTFVALVTRIVAHDVSIRRAALLECIAKIRKRGDEYMHDCEAKDSNGKKYRDTYEMRRTNSARAWAFKDLADELERLAQEG